MRDRLTKKPNMPDQHKTGSESCQAIRMPASVTSPSVASGTWRALAAPLSRWRNICSGSPCSAAFWRRVVLVLLILSLYGFNSPRVFADTRNEAPGEFAHRRSRPRDRPQGGRYPPDHAPH